MSRKSVLEKNDIRIPTIDKPWTAEEFTAALTKIAKATGTSSTLGHAHRQHR